MARTRPQAVHHTTGRAQRALHLAQHVVLALTVDAIALALHAHLQVRIALAVLCVAVAHLWHRRRH